MVCVAGCQHPSVPQVKGHTVKHSYWQTEADRGIKTEETILLPASLWDFTELCRITVCSSLSAMLLSQWPDWFTEHYEHCIIAVYPHIYDSWIFVGSIHKHLQSSLANMKQWKIKEPGKLHNTVCWEGSNCPLPRFKTFSQGNVLYPYVFELLHIIYAHANITITSSDEVVGSMLMQGLIPGYWIYTHFWMDMSVPLHGMVVNQVTIKLASFEIPMKRYWITVKHNCILHVFCWAAVNRFNTFFLLSSIQLILTVVFLI